MNIHFRMALAAGLLSAVTIGAALAQQQQQRQGPRPSPNATVSQTVGLTEITI